MNDHDAPLHILFTGGWDSTFRIAQAVLEEGRIVQPHYLIDEGRKSTLHELQAIRRIKDCLDERVSAGRVLPVAYASRGDLRPDERVGEAHEALNRRMHVGRQYEWLTRFARQRELRALELCIERYPVGAESELFRHLAASVEGTGHACRLRPALGDGSLAVLFAPFRFPTLHLTKLDMGSRAREHGFFDLMQQTWFCHQPILSHACGRCRPCTIAQQTCARSISRVAPLKDLLWQIRRVIKGDRV